MKYPAVLGTKVKCDRPSRQSHLWKQFQGKTGVVVHNGSGEIAVQLTGGGTFWFAPAELTRVTAS